MFGSEEKSGKILLVDDDKPVALIIKYHLKKEGYDIHYEENGSKALEYLEKNRPDLIISDVNMPVMNGYELYKKVSVQKEFKFIPFIFMTSLSDREDIILAKKLGVDEYITKPVDKELLLITVEAKLNRFMELKKEKEKDLMVKVSQMYDTMSHEMNTPIAIIQGFTEISEMLLDNGTFEIGELKSFLDGIKSGNNRLKKLAEKILILNSIDRGFAQESYFSLPETYFVDLRDVITSTFANFDEIIEEKNINLILNLDSQPLHVKTVSSHITSVIENLIDNAMKFAPKKNGEVKINTYKNGLIRLEIEDNGMGIPDEEMGNIFKRYYQYNRKTHEQQGIGIGLAIVKALTEINKVNLDVKSFPGKGSQFTLSFKESKENFKQ